MKIYIDPNGTQYPVLPNPWQNHSPMTDDIAVQLGWTIRTEAAKTCTKYQLVTVLQADYPNLYEQLLTAYAENPIVAFYWNTVIELDRTNAQFKQMQEVLGVSDAIVEEIFAKTESLPDMGA